MLSMCEVSFLIRVLDYIRCVSWCLRQAFWELYGSVVLLPSTSYYKSKSILGFVLFKVKITKFKTKRWKLWKCHCGTPYLFFIRTTDTLNTPDLKLMEGGAPFLVSSSYWTPVIFWTKYFKTFENTRVWSKAGILERGVDTWRRERQWVGFPFLWLLAKGRPQRGS